MKRRLNILQSKLAISKALNPLKRSRLIHALKEISRKKLALVVAGAGYGKTTLAAQTVAEMEADCVWYCLDESDRDFASFIGYLLAGIRKHQPEFGKDFGERFLAPPVSRRIREELLLEFLEEIENRISNDMIIVLDDYHMVEDAPEISGSMEFLLARMPRILHLMVISRRDPALRISRYRAMSEVIDIGESDLSFRIDEMEQLCGRLPEIAIDAANLEKLFKKTGGWAAGLMLFFNALKGRPRADVDESLFDIGISRRFIFQYLEENVFERLSEDIKDFMVKSSLLTCLDPELCDILFDRKNSRSILSSLCENHLLTFPCGETATSFQYHRLLQDFLQDRLERIFGKAEVCRLHHDMGKSMEERGDIQAAIDHFLEGECFEEICRIVARMVFQDFIACPLGFLLNAFKRVPAEVIGKDARLLYVGARLASLNGDIRGAIRGLQTALERFRTEENSTGVANCLKDLGFHYYLTGDVTRAQKQMEGLRGRAHEDPFFPAEVTGYMILFSAILGKMEEADRYCDSLQKSLAGRAKAEADLVRSWMNLCYTNRFHHSGDFERAHELNLKTLNAFVRMKIEAFLPLANFQAALTSFYRSRPEEGCRYAEDGLSLAGKIGIYDHQLAWLLYARALNGFGKGALEQAMLDGEESLDIFKAWNNLWGQASVYELFSMICRRRSKLSEAEGFVRTGLDILDGLGLAGTQAALALRFAEILIDRGKYADAHFLLDQYRRDIQVSGFHLFMYRLLGSRIHVGLEASEKAVEEMEAGLEIASTFHYDAWILKESAWVIPVLAECYAKGKMQEYIERLLKGADPREARDVLCSLKNAKEGPTRRAANRLMAVLPENAPAPLKIRCLGKFEVFIQDRPIPRSQWRSAKATRLFKYMVLKRDQGFIPKEVLLELAWPDEDADVTNRRFHVALSALRKVLEPDLRRGVPSSYILRQKDAYRLEMGDGGSVDFQKFLRELGLAERAEGEGAEAALALYLSAESMYGGTLFEEDPYEDWLMTDREMLRNKYLYTLGKIIRLYEHKKAWKKCIGYAEKYLSVDPYEETVYCRLMRFHSCLGETSRIVRAFERCRTFIMQDLGCPLNEDTVGLYRSLTGKV